MAVRAAEQIELYLKNNLNILSGLANNINRIYLNQWQKEIMIKNYATNFEVFKKICLLDGTGQEVATSNLEEKLSDRSGEDFFQSAIQGNAYFSEIFISDNLVPSIIIALPIKKLNSIDGVIAGEIDLSDMWKLIDSIRIGEKGIALVVSKSGLLIAHGDNERKQDVFKQKRLHDLTIVKTILQGEEASLTYKNQAGLQVLGVGHPLKLLNWGVIIEQPTSEAFMIATWMTRILSISIVIVLVIMIIIGIAGGKRAVKPIYELIGATRVIASGDLRKKVKVSTGDEFEELADSFNLMSDKLIMLQKESRLNERWSIFARIAAGLVHDLKHPIKNIENCSNLILRLYNDQDYRRLFHESVQKEFRNINRFLSNLHNLTHPDPIATIALNLKTALSEIISLYENETKQKEIEVKLISPAQNLRILADKFLFDRIIKNLMTNAIDAMPRGGLLSITLSEDKYRQAKSVHDGCRNSESIHGKPGKDISGIDKSRRGVSGKVLSGHYEPGINKSSQDKSVHRLGSAEISIEDTGRGIPKERVDTLFTDYISTKRKKLGLGLAVTKKNVSELGGTITVESEPGKGSIFTLSFPLFAVSG